MTLLDLWWSENDDGNVTVLMEGNGDYGWPIDDAGDTLYLPVTYERFNIRSQWWFVRCKWRWPAFTWRYCDCSLMKALFILFWLIVGDCLACCLVLLLMTLSGWWFIGFIVSDLTLLILLMVLLLMTLICCCSVIILMMWRKWWWWWWWWKWRLVCLIHWPMTIVEGIVNCGGDVSTDGPRNLIVIIVVTDCVVDVVGQYW